MASKVAISKLSGGSPAAQERESVRVGSTTAVRSDLSTPSFWPTSINQRAFTYYRRLRRLSDYVEVHYGCTIRLEDAANVAGLEKTSFSRFFHDKTGVRFREWLAYVRVSKAQQLLSNQNLTVTETAHSVGFNDLRTFERNFKRCVGMSPWQYKKSVRPC